MECGGDAVGGRASVFPSAQRHRHCVCQNTTVSKTHTEQEQAEMYQGCCEGSHQGPREGKNRVPCQPEREGLREQLQGTLGKRVRAGGTAGAKALR